jgi:hypothetical protein
MDAYSPKVAVRGDASAEAMPMCRPPFLPGFSASGCHLVFCSASSPTAATADPRARDPEQNGKSCLSETFLSADCRPRRQSPHPPRLASPHLSLLPLPPLRPPTLHRRVSRCVCGREGGCRPRVRLAVPERKSEGNCCPGRQGHTTGRDGARSSVLPTCRRRLGRPLLSVPSLCPQAKLQSTNWKYCIGLSCTCSSSGVALHRPPAGENGKPPKPLPPEMAASGLLSAEPGLTGRAGGFDSAATASRCTAPSKKRRMLGAPCRGPWSLGAPLAPSRVSVDTNSGSPVPGYLLSG